MKTIEIMTQCLDDGLRLLRQTLSRQVPDESLCADSSYVNDEREWFAFEVQTQLDIMQQRAKRILDTRTGEYKPLVTTELTEHTLADLRKLTHTIRHELTDECNDTANLLLTYLGKLLNIELTDNECEQKWLALEHKASLIPRTALMTYTKLDMLYDQMGKDAPKKNAPLMRFLFDNPGNELEVFAFVSRHTTTVKTKQPRQCDHTFTYIRGKTNPERIKDFCEELLRLGWIRQEGNADKMPLLLTGETYNFKITWYAEQSTLYYLFYLLTKEDGPLKCPKGVSQWKILEGHFVHPDGSGFINFNKKSVPTKTKSDIEFTAGIL